MQGFLAPVSRSPTMGVAAVSAAYSIHTVTLRCLYYSADDYNSLLHCHHAITLHIFLMSKATLFS